MDAIIKKLSEIEEAAEAIVEHANEQKIEVEHRLQKERDAFDRELEEKTQEKVRQIRAENEEKMERIVEERKKKNNQAIVNLEQEFADNHTAYAEKILKKIIEV